MRLLVFDVDGTLVDSQHDIIGAMTDAFTAEGLTAPKRAQILSIVGLSLDVAMARLAPEGADPQRLSAAYKDAYVTRRAQAGAAASSPLYPGARALLEDIVGRPDTLLGIATGKSKRGLDTLIEAHGLDRLFATRQVADFHPSKPNPSMLHQAMNDTGCMSDDTVMIGDTSFDMEMAQAARVTGIGVTWGYHSRDALHAAHHLVADFAALGRILHDFQGESA